MSAVKTLLLSLALIVGVAGCSSPLAPSPTQKQEEKPSLIETLDPPAEPIDHQATPTNRQILRILQAERKQQAEEDLKEATEDLAKLLDEKREIEQRMMSLWEHLDEQEKAVWRRLLEAWEQQISSAQRRMKEASEQIQCVQRQIEESRAEEREYWERIKAKD